MIFYRADHTTLLLKLTSDEPLGILDTDYVEDYYGVDSQLTIYNVNTTDETVLSIVPLPGETPGIPNDVFQGSILLSSLPNADYELRGRVRDVIGNYTILTSFGSPAGGERVMPFLFSIEDGVFVPFAGRTHYIDDIVRDMAVIPDDRIEIVDLTARSAALVNQSRIKQFKALSRVHYE